MANRTSLRGGGNPQGAGEARERPGESTSRMQRNAGEKH